MPIDDLLRPNHPEVRLLSQRRIGKLLSRLIDDGRRLPDNSLLPIWIESRTLAEFDELYQPHAGEPDRLMLLAPPDDRGIYDDSAAAAAFERLLFEGYLSQEADAAGAASVEAYRRLRPEQQRELAAVLEYERRLPEEPTESEIAAAAGVLITSLKQFQPEALPFHFPLLEDGDWPEPAAAAALRQRCTLPRPAAESRSIAESDQEPSQAERDMIADCLARGNYARAAILARGRSPWREQAIDNGLAARLGDVLKWTTEQRAAWSEALAALAQSAGAGRRMPEERALVQLQRIVADLSTNLSDVAPVEWITSLGRRPPLRSLKPVRDIVLLRRLRAAMKQAARASLSEPDRHLIEELLEAEVHRVETRARSRFTPQLESAVQHAGLIPANRPERIARDKLVAELLDRLCETGFLRLADVRDAVARNQLKLPDLRLGELLRRDALLQLDRELAERLPGVYHRGEIYLRTFQRGSSLAFGTPLGRWITLWLALPFGGAYVIVEAIKHFGHAMADLRHAVLKFAGLESEPAHAAPHHEAASYELLIPVLLLGTFILAVINSRVVRAALVDALLRIGRGLRIVLLDLPQAAWASPPVRLLLENRLTRFISRYLLPPALAATTTALAASVLIPDVRFALLGGAAAFIVVGVLGLTRWGQQLREDVLEYLHDVQRRFVVDFLPGLANWLIWAFRETLGWMERMLFAIDEWFRYRPGRSGNLLPLKIMLGLLWFPIAYMLRFVFYLLLEPQVNPIKHFPVVTVAHKVLLPLIPSLSSLINVSLETAGLIISAIPGIFGFLAWELKENWKLYAANRRRTLPREMIGHHGETMTGLLRPGFHSGTIPKLFRTAQRLFARPTTEDRAARIHRVEHDFHHLHTAIERLLTRNLLAFWHTVPELAALEPRVDSVRFGYQRVEAAIASARGTPLRISFENIDGEIVATIDDNGWMADLDPALHERVRASLDGLFTIGAAGDLSWHQWLQLWSE